MTCGGCLLPAGARDAVALLTALVATFSVLCCGYVLVAMHTLPKRITVLAATREEQMVRMVRIVFVANLLFALSYAVPAHHGLTFSTISLNPSARCVLGALYNFARFFSLFVEIRLIGYTFYCSRFERAGISLSLERQTLYAVVVAPVVVMFGFFGSCWRQREKTGGPSIREYDTTTSVFLGIVVIVVVVRLLLYIETRYQARLAAHVAPQLPPSRRSVGGKADWESDPDAGSFGPPGSSGGRWDGSSTGLGDHEADSSLLEAMLRPLQWYPVVFGLTLLPQAMILIYDDQHNHSSSGRELFRGIAHIFVPMRGALNMLVYLSDNPEALQFGLTCRLFWPCFRAGRGGYARGPVRYAAMHDLEEHDDDDGFSGDEGSRDGSGGRAAGGGRSAGGDGSQRFSAVYFPFDDVVGDDNDNGGDGGGSREQSNEEKMATLHSGVLAGLQ